MQTWHLKRGRSLDSQRSLRCPPMRWDTWYVVLNYSYWAFMGIHTELTGTELCTNLLWPLNQQPTDKPEWDTFAVVCLDELAKGHYIMQSLVHQMKQFQNCSQMLSALCSCQTGMFYPEYMDLSTLFFYNMVVVIRCVAWESVVAKPQYLNEAYKMWLKGNVQNYTW